MDLLGETVEAKVGSSGVRVQSELLVVPGCVESIRTGEASISHQSAWFISRKLRSVSLVSSL